MAWTSAFWRVAGHIEEIAFFLTRRTCFRWNGCRVDKSTLAAFPKSETAIGADVSSELAFCGVTAVGTLIFFMFIFHFVYLRPVESFHPKCLWLGNLKNSNALLHFIPLWCM